MREGCRVFLAHIVYTMVKRIRWKDKPIVREFAEVFLDDLLGLPSHGEVGFTIKILHGIVLFPLHPIGWH